MYEWTYVFGRLEDCVGAPLSDICIKILGLWLQNAFATCLISKPKVGELYFLLNYQMCEMHWIAEWVQVCDLPVIVAECVSCVLLHGAVIISWAVGYWVWRAWLGQILDALCILQDCDVAHVRTSYKGLEPFKGQFCYCSLTHLSSPGLYAEMKKAPCKIAVVSSRPGWTCALAEQVDVRVNRF